MVKKKKKTKLLIFSISLGVFYVSCVTIHLSSKKQSKSAEVLV